MGAGPTQEEVRYHTRKRSHALHAEALALGYLPEWQGESKKPTRDFWFYIPGLGGTRIALFPSLLRASNGEACLRWDAILTNPAGQRYVEPYTRSLEFTLERLLAKPRGNVLGAHGKSTVENESP